MTPKEKAIDLYNKFYNYESHMNSVEVRHLTAKGFALICCNEVLGDMGADRECAFWTEVKQEIEKL